MRILFAVPGHLRTVPMGKFCYDAFLGLGHETTLFDFGENFGDKFLDRASSIARRKREEKHRMNRRLRRAVDEVRPDLFVALFGFDVSEQSLAYLRRKGIPSACWWINDPFQFQRSLTKAHAYDFMFSNSAGSVEQYHAAGIRNAHFLPTACDPAVHHSVPPQVQYQCEVCFAGDWSQVREKMLAGLAAQFDVKIFGPWKKKLAADSRLHANLVDGFFTPGEMASMFSSAKVVLNVHTWFGTFDHGVNPRLFEAAGCGAFQVVDWKQEIPTLFDCQSELKCYRSEEELHALIRAALASDPERQAMAQAAQRRAYGEHTYRHRMATLLQIMQNH